MKKKILFIKQIDIEGPENLAPFFEKKGYSSQVAELYNGDILPEDLTQIAAIVCLGGPMNVYEEDKHPFLVGENRLIRKALNEKIPYMGICLGSQLLAKACSAKVGKSPQKEVGFSTVKLTADGKKDPLFQGLSGDLCVYQWHEDMFEIPAGAKLLASSAVCPHQAFRVGDFAYGLQFHCEITGKSIHEWSDAYFKEGDAAGQLKKKQMLDDYAKKKEELERTAKILFDNFLKLVKSADQTRKD